MSRLLAWTLDGTSPPASVRATWAARARCSAQRRATLASRPAICASLSRNCSTVAVRSSPSRSASLSGQRSDRLSCVSTSRTISSMDRSRSFSGLAIMTAMTAVWSKSASRPLSAAASMRARWCRQSALQPSTSRRSAPASVCQPASRSSRAIRCCTLHRSGVSSTQTCTPPSGSSATWITFLSGAARAQTRLITFACAGGAGFFENQERTFESTESTVTSGHLLAGDSPEPSGCQVSVTTISTIVGVLARCVN